MLMTFSCKLTSRRRGQGWFNKGVNLTWGRATLVAETDTPNQPTGHQGVSGNLSQVRNSTITLLNHFQPFGRTCTSSGGSGYTAADMIMVPIFTDGDWLSGKSDLRSFTAAQSRSRRSNIRSSSTTVTNDPGSDKNFVTSGFSCLFTGHYQPGKHLIKLILV